MKNGLKKSCTLVSIALMALIAGAFLLVVAGARINTSDSIPRGLYWMVNRPIVSGDYVIFCPPRQALFQQALVRGYINHGVCPGGFGYLMKQVRATQGDRVSILFSGVWVNGQYLRHSRPFLRDGAGRSLPQLTLTNHALNESELLLMTNQSPLSFDARYFGVLSQSQIKAVIVPILTWPLRTDLFHLKGH